MTTGSKKTLLLLVLLGWTSHAGGADISAKDREEFYDKAGMKYAKELWQKQDNSEEDEKRSHKAEVLTYSVRERAIHTTEQQLKKYEKNPSLKKEIYYRLGLLEEQQAEGAGRKGGSDSVPLAQTHMRKAIAWQEKILKEFPNYKTDEVLFNLGENYSHLQELAKAESYYTRLIRDHKNSKLLADALLAVGNLHFDRKSFASARTYFNQILTTPETNLLAYAHYKVAWCFFNENRYPEAMSSLERAVAASKKFGDKEAKRLGVEDEALSDLVLFYSEYANPNDARAYFERVVGVEKGRELRINLAKRYFDQGQHENAKTVAKALLAEGVPPKDHGQLLLVLLSVAEKTKDLSVSAAAAKDLAAWVHTQKKDEASLADTEEYFKSYCLRAHYAAETLKKRELWQHAKLSYNTYFEAFPEAKSQGDMRYRFGGLLLEMHEAPTALTQLELAAPLLPKDYPKRREALQLRIEALETAAKEDKKIPDSQFIRDYDEFAAAFPEDKLAPEAAFKAAERAKKTETPEQVATRFRAIAEHYPNHALAKTAISRSLAMLVESGRWNTLKNESTALQGKLSDKDLESKLSEVQELAEIKLAEELEKKGQFEEARGAYEKLLDGKFSNNFLILCLVRLAKLGEAQLKQPELAVKYWRELQKRFPDSNEAHGAHLELARLSESLKKPEDAIASYLAYSNLGKAEANNQALTNAALLEEKLGERTRAAEYFGELANRLSSNSKKSKEAQAALEASCNNYLLTTYHDSAVMVFVKLKECSERLSQSSEGARWLARSAWALEKLGKDEDAQTHWRQLGELPLKNFKGREEIFPYLALGRLKRLEDSLARFRSIRFTESNEKPVANIKKKTNLLEGIEAAVTELNKIGSARTQVAALKVLQAAYNDFAETMENAAFPKKAGAEEKEALHTSFVTVAKQLREKAAAIAIPTINENREPAAETGTKTAEKDESVDPVAKEYF